MIINILVIVAILFVIFCIVALTVFNSSVKKQMANRQKFAYIKFDSKTIFNQPIDSSIFQDKEITMVNIWATYCSSCINELTDLQAIAQKYQNQDVGLLGIISDLKEVDYKEKDLNKAVKLIKQNNITYPNIYADNTFVDYARGKLFMIPTTIFVDRFGNVVGDVIESALTKDQYMEIIDKLLNSETFEYNKTNLSCTIDGKCEDKK